MVYFWIVASGWLRLLFSSLFANPTVREFALARSGARLRPLHREAKATDLEPLVSGTTRALAAAPRPGTEKRCSRDHHSMGRPVLTASAATGEG
jgi:hypothetical protein